MTAKQRKILAWLYARRSRLTTIDELVAEFGATKQAMQSTLRILERKHLVMRGYSLHEERVRMTLHLTPEGVTLGASL